MKLPRVECPICGRNVAAAPILGQAAQGRVWRHDAPDARRLPDGTFVSCKGAWETVNVTMAAAQLTFDVTAPEPAADDDAPTLFVI